MSTQYCAQCGAALVLGLVAGHERPHCAACGFVVYFNPVPVGLAVVEHDGQLLLVRRATEPLKGYWAPPAGHVEVGESVEQATVRETQEEAGVQIALDGLIGVYSHADVEVVIVAYRGHSHGGEPKAGEDAAEVALFAPGALPVQPPPAASRGTALDRWFYDVIQEVTFPWREPPGYSRQ